MIPENKPSELKYEWDASCLTFFVPLSSYINSLYVQLKPTNSQNNNEIHIFSN